MATKARALPEDEISRSFGRRFTTLCEIRFPGEKQVRLAKRFHVSQAMISDYMSGKKLPSSAQWVNMCRILGCTMEYLFLGTEFQQEHILDMSALTEEHRTTLRAVKESLENIR